MKTHKYNFGVIGNCSYLAYIDREANVIWQCWPYFDSSFVFGKMLDPDGGEFYIKSADEDFTTYQYYLKNTNILCTEFSSSSGSFRVTDFSPRFNTFERWHKPLQLVRIVKRLSGNPRIRIKCTPTYNYKNQKAQATFGSNHITFKGIDLDLRLTTNVSKKFIIDESEFALTENLYMMLSANDHLEAPLESTCEDFLRKTTKYWRLWVERAAMPLFAQQEVIRSGLILKLHQNEDTGAMIASGSTSLPEHPGQGRNWDYRYCWIRDAYFTLSAFDFLGHFEEAERFSHFLQNVALKSPDRIQPVFCIDGSFAIPEKELDLFGYLGEKPVRVGNLAYKQIQNDVYGQMILALLPLYLDQRLYGLAEPPELSLLEHILDKMKDSLHEPDSGIWEYRDIFQKHCETYLFHWAGALGVQKVALSYGRKDIFRKAQHLEKEARAGLESCYSHEMGAYGAYAGSKDLNASELLLITMNYLKHDPEKARAHLKVIEEKLVKDKHLVFRYLTDDGLGETKSTFLICSFWYAEALACLGRIDEAFDVFDRLLKYSNHLGLFSEDVCPQDLSQWGNFPQTYSHVGLINSAFRISKSLNRLIFES